jgi:hypothetical protein
MKQPLQQSDRLRSLGEFVQTVRTAHQLAESAKRTTVHAGRVLFLKVKAAEWAMQAVAHLIIYTPSQCPKWLTKPPTKKANGNMNRVIHAAVFLPSSREIMNNVAMHGINNVIVTIATRT